jgi:hypothetical protein
MMNSRRISWTRNIAQMGKERNGHTISVRNLKGKRKLGRPRRKWMDNIQMDVAETEWSDRQ